MRLILLALTALGMATSSSHVAAGQQQWQDFGAVLPDLMKQSFYEAAAAAARPPTLAKRDGACNQGDHPCSDLNSTLCCPNTDYCIINEDSEDLAVQCCELGSTCGFTCPMESYYALVTITETVSAGGGTTTATAGACVGRACSGTNYQCPQSMGGGCCAYGQNCASDRQCLDFGATSTSSSSRPPAVATMIPSGCSKQGDSTCSVGGPGIATTTGCCGAGYTCAMDASSRAVCDPTSSTTGSPVPTGSGISVVQSPQGGLSTAAKAGIAVAVVVASALVIGAATWFCIGRRRRRHPGTRSTTTGNEMGSGVGGGGGGGGVRLAAAGRFESDDGGLRSYGPSSGPHMSEVDGYAASSSAAGGGGVGGRPGPLQGLGHDYFGPVAASGPYTTPPEFPHPTYYGGGGAAGRDDHHHPARPVRGDGATPHGPDDIASAVEIGGGSQDSLVLQKKKGGRHEEGEMGGGGSELDGGGGSGSDTMLAARRQNMRQGAGSPTVRDSIAGAFELYGSDVPPARTGTAETRGGGVAPPRPLGTPGSELSGASELGTPSPMSHEELQQQQQAKQQVQSNKSGAAG